MRLTIHRGTKEIGGSCVEVATASSRLVLDLGLPLVDGNREPFDSRAALAKTPEVLKAERVIPPVPGLFDTDHSPPNAIFLSHAHLDHAGLIPLSRAEVPVYASAGTSKMMLAAAVFGGQKELDRTRFREVVAGQPVRVGDFTVTPMAVDHSVYGSVAFLVEAGGKSLLYTGDFRDHGRKPGMTRDLLEYAARRTIDALVVEGTHFGGDREQSLTEHDLEGTITELVRTAPALVLATFSPLDVDRIVTLYKAARATGRTFVPDAYTAFVLHLIGRRVKVPKPARESGIRVYFNALFERRSLPTIREKFEADRIELSEILAEPQKYVMAFRPSMTGFDFGGRLPPRCRCLYGYWAGYLTRPDWVTLQEQVATANGDFVRAHVSGHAYVADIVRFVTAVNARTVIPIHTFEPQMFEDHFPNVTRLADGVPFDLS